MAATRDLLIEQSLPVNLDAERFVLGAIMTDVSAFLQVGGKIAEEDFSLEKHRVIFRRICNLQDRGETIDRVTLANELMKHGELQSMDGLSYLVSLDDGLPQIYSLDSYVNIVKEKSLLRRIITVSQGLINRCITGTEDAIQILGAAEEALMNWAMCSRAPRCRIPRRSSTNSRAASTRSSIPASALRASAQDS